MAFGIFDNLSLLTPHDSDEGCAARRREVENALLVQTLCERQPNSSVRSQLLSYITGELSREQAFADLYAGMR